MSYSSEVLADSPLGYWRMGEASGTAIADSSGNGRDGAFLGGTYTRGVAGLLTGDADKATSFASAWADAPTTNPTALTVEAIIKPNWTGGAEGMIINRDVGSGTRVFQFRREANGTIGFVWFPSAGGVGYFTSNTATVQGGTYHVAATWDGTTASIYINGVLDVSSTANPGTLINGGALPVRFGAFQDGTQTAKFIGVLDELAVYGTALSGTRIAAHYAAATTAPAGNVTGSVSAALPALSASSVGTAAAPVVSGAVAATLPRLSASVAGTHTSNDQAGDVAATLPALTGSVLGDFTAPDVLGSVSATLPALTALVEDRTDAAGAVAATLPALSVGVVASVANGVVDNDPDDATVVIVDTDDGELDFFPPLAIPPAGFVERPLIRRSVIVPDLATIPGAVKDPTTGELRIPDNIYDALPLAAPVEEIGSLRVLMAEAGDVTFFRDGLAQPISDRSEEPFGDSTGSLEIPRLTSMDEEPDSPAHALWWTINRANVQFVLKRPDGTVTRLWSGLAISDDTGNDDQPVWRKDLVGSLWQAAHSVHRVPNMLDPTDIGSLIPAALNGVTSRRYPKIPNVSTGIMSRQRGSWSDSQLAYAQNLLATAWTVGGNQWTIAKVPNSVASYVMRLKKTAPEWTVTNGARGVKVSLSQDLTQGRNVIYGRGVGPDGYAWMNTKYPNLRADSAPLFTGPVLGLGASGAKVSEWQERARDLGYSIAVDGTISSSDVAIIETIQRRYGLQVDGVIGPQTWAATFDVGGNGGDLSGVIRLPLAAHPSTQYYLFNADGSVAGLNPDYDSEAFVVEDEVDFGSGVTRAEGIQSAQQIVDLESTPALSGTITLETDPREGSRMLIPVGDKITLVGFRGKDRVLHIVARERDWQNLTVTLTVDESARDAMTVAQIHARNKESRRDPARRPGNVNRRSRQDVDQVVPFDGESGAGRIPKFATFGGLWSVIRIPVSETGRVAVVDMQTSGPLSELYVAMFGAPIQPAHLVKYVGNPSSTDARWEANRAVLEDTFGWIEAFGSPDEPGGYFPGLKSNSSPLTGRLKDTGGFEYVSAKPPWVWVAVWTPVSSYVSGRILPAPVI